MQLSINLKTEKLTLSLHWLIFSSPKIMKVYLVAAEAEDFASSKLMSLKTLVVVLTKCGRKGVLSIICSCREKRIQVLDEVMFLGC